MDYTNLAYVGYTGPVVYPQAIALSIFAGIATILVLVPFYLQFKNHNIPMTALTLCIILMNIQNTINPIIWPNDNIDSWYNGSIFCDIETKIQVGISITIPASAALICRNLADVLSSQHLIGSPSSSTRRKQTIFEVIVCVGLPVYVMVVHIFVQPLRYFIYGIIGCQYSLLPRWPTLALVIVWPLLFNVVAIIYSIMIVVRLISYHQDISVLMAHAQLSSTRFAKVFVLAFIMVLYSSMGVYSFIRNSVDGFAQPWRWDNLHPEDWSSLISLRESVVAGCVDRWIQVVTGFVTFAVLGIGGDARTMLRRWTNAVVIRFIEARRWLYGLWTKTCATWHGWQQFQVPLTTRGRQKHGGSTVPTINKALDDPNSGKENRSLTSILELEPVELEAH